MENTATIAYWVKRLYEVQGKDRTMERYRLEFIMAREVSNEICFMVFDSLAEKMKVS